MRPRERAPDIPIRNILLELGAEHVPDVRGDGWVKMLCPFHPDRTPSASVSRYGFVCFPCDITGDAIKLIREKEGIESFEDALSRAAELAGVSDTGGTGSPETVKGSRSLLDISGNRTGDG